MRSEKEIRNKIKIAESMYKDAKDGIARLAIRQAILAYRWSLGEKYVEYYFCYKCQEPHKFKQCPKCGGNQVTSMVWSK